ncbi:MAG: peptidoglycan DD-metalloendopeptidase family protein [Gammaproteobacteria bacterium]|nr:peptidoglycan DD-metalloendopeptidase family protein [Gammaproteobacteria bacterium]
MKKYLSIMLILSATAGCQETGGLVPVVETGERKSVWSNQSVHEVRAGETLYSIAWRYGMDYRELAKSNNIESPFTIFVKQRLKLRPSKPGYKNTVGSNRGMKLVKKAPVETRPRKQVISASGVKWYWPLDGKVVNGFSLQGNINKGLDIAGKNGQPVTSAAAGTVVYAGGGLRGYGKLVIVKHDDHYLSAYGNNSDILVKEGDKVRHGKVIAKLGSNGSDGSGNEVLHFEIRRDGKPVDPLGYLPKRK